MARSYNKYPYREQWLEIFKKYRLAGEVESLNHFVDVQEKYFDEIDFDGDINPVPYGTVYQWLQSKKYQKYKSLLDDPVAERKTKGEPEEETEEENQEENQEEPEEEKEEGDPVKIEKNIKDLPRQKTKNPDYKGNLPTETERKKPNKNNTLLYSILGISSLITIGTIYFKTMKGGSKKNEQRETNRGNNGGNEPELQLI